MLVLRLAMFGSWLIFGASLLGEFPISPDQVQHVGIALGVSLLGVVAGVMALRVSRNWPIVGCFAATAFLAMYIAGLVELAKHEHSWDPNVSFLKSIEQAFISKWELIVYKLDQGHPFFSVLTLYDHFLMPLLQLVLLAALLTFWRGKSPAREPRCL